MSYCIKIEQEKNAKDSDARFIAKQDEKIIGYLNIKVTSNTQDKEALIEGLYIEPEYVGQGISRALMQRAEKWARNNEVKVIHVNEL
ncbi:MAG: GNAT family N-acetyltransferase [Clostridia bacterium]|nr:GNAT family N-acetyltransferase [Clostridia bacterium]